MLRGLFLATVFLVLFQCTNAQKNDANFESFKQYFEPVIDSFSLPENFIWNEISTEMALRFICQDDSSKLYWEDVGVDYDTDKVIYREKKEYKYKAFSRLEMRNHTLLIIDEYDSTGRNEFTFSVNIYIYDNKGKQLSSKPFYIFDDTGKLNEISSTLYDKGKFITSKRIYQRDEKGRKLNQYDDIMEEFLFKDELGKFEFV